jgi:hypothetical protein
VAPRSGSAAAPRPGQDLHTGSFGGTR